MTEPLPADVFGLLGRSVDGKYDVEALVAEGGFGVVYRATHRTLRKPVAVKVLKTPASLDLDLRAQFLAKFAQEAHLIADLDHPGIVRVLDFGASPMPCGDSAPWMVLEWLDGVSLEHDLDARRARGGRAPAEALAVLRPALEALAFAHDAGIAHRDLKPANLMMVRTRQGDPTLRVLDFGIAKVMRAAERDGASGQTATQSRLQAFSLPYAAPEQVSGTRTGPWTDVHALGLILTELLTDAAPYAAEDLTALYAAVLSPARPSPARRGLEVGAWEAVIAKATAFKPSERFQHARDLLVALEREVPRAAQRVDASESITTPRARPASGASTTLRPAEVRSQVSARTPTRHAAVLAALGGATLLVAILAPLRPATRTHPAQVALTPQAEATPAPIDPSARQAEPVPAQSMHPEISVDAGPPTQAEPLARLVRAPRREAPRRTATPPSPPPRAAGASLDPATPRPYIPAE